MEIQKDTLLRLAQLARLNPDEAEQSSLAKSLGDLVQYIDQIRGLDLSNVEPMMHVTDTAKPLRPDVVQPGLSTEEAFVNAPVENLGHFSIPKTIQ